MRLLLFLIFLSCQADAQFIEVAHAELVDPIARSELIALKQLVNQRFDDQDKAVSAALAAVAASSAAAVASSKEAVTKADAATEKRFDAVNEFRNTLKDQQTLFIQRIEADQRFSQITERVASLQARLDKAEGSGSGASALWQYIIAAIGVALGVFGAYHIISAAKPSRNDRR